jgi:hypothetical protein
MDIRLFFVFDFSAALRAGPWHRINPVRNCHFVLFWGDVRFKPMILQNNTPERYHITSIVVPKTDDTTKNNNNNIAGQSKGPRLA